MSECRCFLFLMGNKSSKGEESKAGEGSPASADRSELAAALAASGEDQKKLGFFAGLKQGWVVVLVVRGRLFRLSLVPVLLTTPADHVVDLIDMRNYATPLYVLHALSIPHWILVGHGGGRVILELNRSAYPAVCPAFACEGPNKFTFRGRRFFREDFNVTNSKGQKLVCSHWQPETRCVLCCVLLVFFFRPNAAAPTRSVFFPQAGDTFALCHLLAWKQLVSVWGALMVVVVPLWLWWGLASASCSQALEALEVALSEGATCVGFDFAGSGMSDGDWVTLGWNEKNDVMAVTSHLRASGTVSTIALWGRRYACVAWRWVSEACRLSVTRHVVLDARLWAAWGLQLRCCIATVTLPSQRWCWTPPLQT